MTTTLDKNSLVALRAIEKADRNFVLATMLRGLYYGDTWFREIPKDIFMRHYHDIVERLLDSPKAEVIIACLKDDPEVILGYSILGKTPGGTALHWLFVKSAWRKIGIAKSLVPNDTKFVTHLTKVGLSILRQHPGVEFNPFAI